MPRDASGNYTLPPGNPVIGGTIISDSWANPTMSDIGAEITNSLDRNGRGGMLVPFRNADGTISGPGITWAAETTSGLFREGLGETRMGILGSPTTRWVDATGQPVGDQHPFEIWNGEAWQSPIADGGDFLLNNDQFLVARNEANSGTVNLIKANVNDDIELGAAPVFMSNTLTVVGGVIANLTGNAATATTAITANIAGVVTDAAQPAITSVGTLTGLTVTAPIAGSVTGSAATAGTVSVAAQPAITSVGILSTLTIADLAGVDTRDVSADANGKLVIGGGGASGFEGFVDGNAAEPGAFFISNTGSGMYLFPGGELGWSVNGVGRLSLNSAVDGLQLNGRAAVFYDGASSTSGDLTIASNNLIMTSAVGVLKLYTGGGEIHLGGTNTVNRGLRFTTNVGTPEGAIRGFRVANGVNLEFAVGPSGLDQVMTLERLNHRIRFNQMAGVAQPNRPLYIDTQGYLTLDPP